MINMLSFLLLHRLYMDDVDLKIMFKNLNNVQCLQRLLYYNYKSGFTRVYSFCIKHLVYNVQILIYCKVTVNGDTVITFNTVFHKIIQLIVRHKTLH